MKINIQTSEDSGYQKITLLFNAQVLRTERFLSLNFFLRNKRAVPGLDQRGERSDTVNVYGTEYEASFNPVSGISTQHIKDNHNLNKLPSKLK